MPAVRKSLLCAKRGEDTRRMRNADGGAGWGCAGGGGAGGGTRRMRGAKGNVGDTRGQRAPPNYCDELLDELLAALAAGGGVASVVDES